MNKSIKSFNKEAAVLALLSKKGVLATYENGNHYTAMLTDGTRIRETVDPDEDHFTYDFPENFDICITKYCDGGCPYCHEGATKKGRHGDIMNMAFVDTLTPGTEVAIGGGNALDHPDLIPFLQKLKKRGVLPNLTVNQLHLKKNKALLKRLVEDKLVYGIGVSLMNSSDKEDFEIVDELGNNVVLHVINGILSPKDEKAIKGRKTLILGYKTLRRGQDWLDKEEPSIRKNMEWLKENLNSLSKETKVMSFDCLAIKQLDPRKELGISDKDWDLLFQGDDYSIQASTLYIDAVARQVARASTHPIADRKNFKDESISELFKMTMEGIK